MKIYKLATLSAALLCAGLGCLQAQEAQSATPSAQAAGAPTPQFTPQQRIRTANFAQGRGDVIEATADHLVIKQSSGKTVRVNVTEHTRIISGMPRPQAPAQPGAPATPPQAPNAIKLSDIVVGDYVTAVGEKAEDGTSIEASMVSKMDAARVKEIKERESTFGKTWLQGRITEVKGTSITVLGMIDETAHSFVVDENTTFTQRNQPITLTDLKVGDIIRADGALSGSTFKATAVSIAGPRMMPGGMRPNGGPGGPPNRPNMAPPATQQTPPATAPSAAPSN